MSCLGTQVCRVKPDPSTVSVDLDDGLSGSHVAETQTPLESALALVQILGAQRADRDGQESSWSHAGGMLDILQAMHVDEPTQIAAVLFGLDGVLSLEGVEARFGAEVRILVAGMRELLRLKDLTARAYRPGTGSELETLRRMTLAMASDIRVVILRLASRLQTLRYLARHRLNPDPVVCHETLDVLAPLANRLGLGSLKWELEDLAFRFLEPETYKRIAQQLEERRSEREAFVRSAVQRLEATLKRLGLSAEVSGRPKHIHSIWNKMRSKNLRFEEVQDLRAFRVIVRDIKACYTVLDAVHQCWPPVLSEFDDYISRPKSNGYRSLHTVVTAEDGRTLEIQIRTQAMHQHAEFGVAAHWLYKETSTGRSAGASAPSGGLRQHSSSDSKQEWADRVSWLRQLLMWQQEVGASLGAGEDAAAATATDAARIYLLTPQARVIELPHGATPIDFAYHVHTSLGHRCRGARVDGHLVPLHTPLRNGQTVEIVTARVGAADGPSRDWLNPELGFARSERARAKVKQWFKSQELAQAMATGRERLEKLLQREGRTALSFDELARRLGYADAHLLFLALAREQVGSKKIEEAVHLLDTVPSTLAVASQHDADIAEQTSWLPRKPSIRHEHSPGDHQVLVVGVDALMTQLAQCCRPVPPDAIVGFVTRGRGVSIHRERCRSVMHLAERMPERILPTSWSSESIGAATNYNDRSERYPSGVHVQARDRPGLLRDISDVLARDRLNVIAVSTRSRDGLAHMDFTIEIPHLAVLQQALAGIRHINGVIDAQRRQ
jgi:GTP pyrophosphokinase